MSQQALKSAATGQTQAQGGHANFPTMLERYKNQIAIALPRHMDAERMARIALTSFRSTPRLAECDPTSIFACVIQASQLGLEPGINGEAYLVPFWNNKANQYECQLIPGYRGLIKLARNTAQVENVSCQVVYSNDFAEIVLGTEETLVHKPCMVGDRGVPAWVYCVAHFSDGGKHIEAMTWDDIQKIKARSKSRDKQGNIVGPWDTDEDEMGRKTTVKRASKYWPMSIELATAFNLDTAASMGLPQELKAENILEGDSFVVPNDDTAPEATKLAPAADKAPPKQADKKPAPKSTKSTKSKKAPEDDKPKDDSNTYTVDYLLNLIGDSKSVDDLDYVTQKAQAHQTGDALEKVMREIEIRRKALTEK